jgi:hypothetical protein
VPRQSNASTLFTPTLPQRASHHAIAFGTKVSGFAPGFVLSLAS